MGFEVVGRLAAERRVASLNVVVGHMMTDFEPDFFESGKAAAIEQFGFEAAPK